ncbi:hypothetical protein [Flexivirga sp.]|uniref:hypothetical protein n=1 Tax=Flexivirga sp. TaxID=1962927 RepID=UPI003F7ED51A
MRLPEDIPAVHDFRRQLGDLDWIVGSYAAGSVASGEYAPGVSDIDLVALTAFPLLDAQLEQLARMHAAIDAAHPGAQLGCVYAPVDELPGLHIAHPTWTHGRLVERELSQLTRAELGQFGIRLTGMPRRQVFPPLPAATIRAAARAELTGYWSWAAQRPWLFLDLSFADLALISMTRARHTLRSGELIGKPQALDALHASAGVRAAVRRRRRPPPARARRLSAARARRLRTGWSAWRDVRHTVRTARHAH